MLNRGEKILLRQPWEGGRIWTIWKRHDGCKWWEPWQRCIYIFEPM